jgi:thiol-disulfide isomerase/thioredoxin
MKKLILALFSLTFALNANAENDFSLYPSPIKGPSAMFADKHGNYKTLGHYANKVVILNFWATWCKPCIVEMPSLNRLQQKYKGKLVVIPIISANEDVSKVRSFLRRYKLRDLEYYIDSNNFTAESYQVTGIPTSFVFNKDGKLVSYVDGSINWLYPENIKYIEKLIAE